MRFRDNIKQSEAVLSACLLKVTCFALFIFLFNSCSTKQKQERLNHLKDATSPYLLQHAGNPVDWFPWGEKALSQAQNEDKLLVISIGYASCHWCHVMEKESYSDTTVSQIMNRSFVSIKVDREERPDVDQTYMDAALVLNGQGGWPLNIVALPDGRPVFAGTYFEKEDWLKVLKFFEETYKKDKNELLLQAEAVMDGIKGREFIPLDNIENTFSKEDYQGQYQEILDAIDLEKGGKKGAPKYPKPYVFETLLEAHYFSDNPSALDAVNSTLMAMASGGLYDHLGGGFSRYTLDENWRIPHFEKMLYDNGQMMGLFSNAYRVTKNELFKNTVIETFSFLDKELSDKSGGFYSSIDADSDGEEGKFYTWTLAEIQNLLGKNADAFSTFFNITEKGNWEQGKNVLYYSSADKYHGSSKDLKVAKSALLKERNKRVKPKTDSKIITSWNAVTIIGLVDAYWAFSQKEFLDRAIEAGEFIKTKQLKSDGSLYRSYKDGKSSINGFLDDYASTIKAFIKLYQATYNEEWLYAASNLLEHTLDNFKAPESAMFYYKSQKDNQLITRKIELTDNDLPSSNALMAENLFVLGTYFTRKEYKDQAKQMLQNTVAQIEQNTFYHASWVRLMGLTTHSFYEVAIVGENADTKRDELLQKFIPNAIVLGGETEGTLELLEYKLMEGQTTIYVCNEGLCKLPVTEVGKARPLISKD